MKLLFQVLTMLPCLAIYGQQKLIKINLSDNAPEETSIAINPTNSMQVAAAANISNYYYSSNGGKTWKEKQLKSQFGVWGDPVVHYDQSGNLYFAHLGKNVEKKFPEWIDKMVVQRINHEYDTCFADRFLGFNKGKIQDKEWISSDRQGNIFLSWTEFDRYKSKNPGDHSRIRFAVSSDKGASWSKPVIVSDQEGDCLDGDNTMEGATSCADSKGNVYVCWSGMMKLWFDKSTDAGKTFGTDQVIALQEGGWEIPIKHIYRANGMPFMQCDNSATNYKDRVYVNWTDTRHGDADVFVKYTDDGGANWSGDIRVNNDILRNGADQFSNNMCIDQKTGFVYVVFYDKRNSSTGAFMDVYLASSKDGGKTWENYRLTPTSYITPGAKLFFGDYIDVDAYDGKILPMFTLKEMEKLNVYTTQFNPAKDKEYKKMNVLNAVVLNDSLYIHLSVPESKKFQLNVTYNGRMVNLNRTSPGNELEFVINARGFHEAVIKYKSGRKKATLKVNNMKQ